MLDALLAIFSALISCTSPDTRSCRRAARAVSSFILLRAIAVSARRCLAASGSSLGEAFAAYSATLARTTALVTGSLPEALAAPYFFRPVKMSSIFFETFSRSPASKFLDNSFFAIWYGPALFGMSNPSSTSTVGITGNISPCTSTSSS